MQPPACPFCNQQLHSETPKKFRESLRKHVVNSDDTAHSEEGEYPEPPNEWLDECELKYELYLEKKHNPQHTIRNGTAKFHTDCGGIVLTVEAISIGGWDYHCLSCNQPVDKSETQLLHKEDCEAHDIPFYDIFEIPTQYRADTDMSNPEAVKELYTRLRKEQLDNIEQAFEELHGINTQS